MQQRRLVFMFGLLCIAFGCADSSSSENTTSNTNATRNTASQVLQQNLASTQPSLYTIRSYVYDSTTDSLKEYFLYYDRNAATKYKNQEYDKSFIKAKEIDEKDMDNYYWIIDDADPVVHTCSSTITRLVNGKRTTTNIPPGISQIDSKTNNKIDEKRYNKYIIPHAVYNKNPVFLAKYSNSANAVLPGKDVTNSSDPSFLDRMTWAIISYDELTCDDSVDSCVGLANQGEFGYSSFSMKVNIDCDGDRYLGVDSDGTLSVDKRGDLPYRIGVKPNSSIQWYFEKVGVDAFRDSCSAQMPTQNDGGSQGSS